MLYMTSLHISEFQMAAAFAAAIGFAIFSLLKEKCDERKRA